MGEVKAIGLFAFICLIAATTEALPLWLIIFALAGIASQFWKNIRLPAVLLYSLITFAFGYLVWDSPKVWHRTTATAAFVIATLFYILSPPHRHRVMRFHAGLFSLLVAVLIIPSETYPLPVYLLLTLLLCVSLIAHQTTLQNSLALFALGKTIGKLAIPLALLMLPIYYFFPDIQAPRQKNQTTGIANELEPGRIANLALSDRLAFRVRFEGKIPERKHLYWRTDVFEDGNGLRWTGDARELPKTWDEPLRGGEIAYELMLDSQLDGLVPTLEQTHALGAYEDGLITIKSDVRVVRSTASYLRGRANPVDHFSSPPPRLKPLDPSTPRVMNQVEALRALNPQAQIEKLLSLFRGFHYTLTPGVLKEDDRLDEFLFVTRRGYCEHFAASFASLLRLAGTPARVVVGFVGGAQLGSSRYIQISNRSAHAWAEVWYEGAWHRVDPSSYAIDGSEIGVGTSSQANFVMAWMTFQIEHLILWLKDWAEDIGLIGIGTGVLIVGLISLQVYRVTHRSAALPGWERRMQRLIARLEDKGYRRPDGETVSQYLSRIDGSFQGLAEIYNERKFGEAEESESKLEAELSAVNSRLRKFPRGKV